MTSSTSAWIDNKPRTLSHKNAPLTPEGRKRLIERCRTRPIAHVAAEMGIPAQLRRSGSTATGGSVTSNPNQAGSIPNQDEDEPVSGAKFHS